MRPLIDDRLSEPLVRSTAHLVGPILVVGLHVWAFYASLVLAFVFSSEGTEWSIVAILGMFLGLLTVASATTAMGSLSLFARLTLPPLWIGAHAFLVLAMADPPSLSDLAYITAFAIGSWMVCQMPFWLVRAVTGLRVVHLDAIASQGRLVREQVSIGQLLVITLIVAVVLGVARAIISPQAVKDTTLAGVGAVLIVVGATALIGVATMVSLLQARSPRLGLPLAMALTGLIGGCAYLALDQNQTLTTDRDLQIVMLSLVTQFLWTALNGLVMRSSGWRVVSLRAA
jgi:hypothetical protein